MSFVYITYRHSFSIVTSDPNNMTRLVDTPRLCTVYCRGERANFSQPHAY